LKGFHRPIMAALALTVLAGLGPLGLVPAHAQGLVPSNYFNQPVDPKAPTGVEAEELVFDSVSNTITARGNVVLSASGYVLSGDSLVYRRNSGELTLVGDASVKDPSGNLVTAPSINISGGLKEVFLQSLTITGYDGSQVTADSMDYDQALQTVLVNANYSPCGTCIDDKGRRIGWSMSAAKVVYNAADKSVTLEQPSLSLLGVPVAWLPYLWLPDLSNDALGDFTWPNVDYGDKTGLKIEVPVKAYSSRFTDIILTPTVLSRQGFLMGAEWIQRSDRGSFRIKASGLYQFDKNAFSYPESQRDWRGAIQASGSFRPIQNWEVGGSYAVFSDYAYLDDYRQGRGKATVNEVYATHLTADTYFDARVQKFNRLGNFRELHQERQGLALPNVRFERSFKLPEGAGQIDVESRILGVYRERDSRRSINGVIYGNGYAGTKMHAMGQASWQNQFIAGGAVITPFAGVRVDAASYDNTSVLAAAPASSGLLGLTPIAALDVRYPMIARSPGVTHLVEPIAQLVYRGDGSSAPGITNDDSHSLVFDDTNLFSYNRFTGIDRQETGLRLNIGGRYLATLDSGNYLELVAGQSFQLAGSNAFADADPTRVGETSGLETDNSYAVLGAYGRVMDAVTLGGKVQIDTGSFEIARAGLGVQYSQDGWSGALNYRYAEATPQLGNPKALHEVGIDTRVPVAEYWSVSSSLYWDLAANNWLIVGGGVDYDDGYLNIGASASRTGPTHSSPNDTRFMATFRIKSPSGFNLGYSGGVPTGGL
jgi:LPS-assembly protein